MLPREPKNKKSRTTVSRVQPLACSCFHWQNVCRKRGHTFHQSLAPSWKCLDIVTGDIDTMWVNDVSNLVSASRTLVSPVQPLACSCFHWQNVCRERGHTCHQSLGPSWKCLDIMTGDIDTMWVNDVSDLVSASRTTVFVVFQAWLQLVAACIVFSNSF